MLPPEEDPMTKPLSQVLEQQDITTKSVIDLRADTGTRPTPGMRKAMAEAEVGDDVYGEDPTVNRLQDRVAGMLGKECAIWVPTGTMANQIAVGSLVSHGDEIVCERGSHLVNY